MMYTLSKNKSISMPSLGKLLEKTEAYQKPIKHFCSNTLNISIQTEPYHISVKTYGNPSLTRYILLHFGVGVE
jgi:hypothetical protein